MHILFKNEARKYAVMVIGYIVPDSGRCVQCGICTYNCPVGIDVRFHIWRGMPIKNNQCLACGECVSRCPRGVLHFAQTDIFSRQAA
jgi:ferredoxin